MTTLSPSVGQNAGNYYLSNASSTAYQNVQWSYANSSTVGFDSIDITFQGHTTRIPVMQQVQAVQYVPPLQPSGPPSEFNRYVNASDLMEEFIAWLGTQDVRQGDVMGLPVELFIKWLIIRACEQDGEEPNVTIALPAPVKQPRCLGCQRYIKAGIAIPLHDQRCADLYYRRSMVAA